MAKINNRGIYGNISNPSLLDFLLGTKEEDGSTKSFPLQSIIQLINGVNGKNNIQYQFSDGSDPDIDYASSGTFFTNNNNTSLPNFTELIFNKENLQSIDLSLLFNKIAESNDIVIRIEHPEDPNIFFNLKVLSFVENSEYFSFEIQPFKNFYSGSFENEKIYSIYFDLHVISEEEKADKIIKSGDINISGLTISILENDFQWRINQQDFLNTPELINFPIPPAADGFYRSDILVGTSNNDYQLIQGTPDNSASVEPQAPINTIRLAGISLFGAIVGQPTPTPMTNFIEKSERANVVLTGSGVINQLDLVDEKATIVFKGSITRLNTISYASVPYNGKRITLFNAQATPVTIGHSVSGFGVDFVFANGQDYVLAPNETIEFSFDITYAPYAHHRLIGSKGIGTWSELQGKPSTFPPSPHTHTVSQITDFPTFKTIENQSIFGAGNIDLNKSDVGLSNVDNTSDANKPVSIATQTALNSKVSLAEKGAANGVAILGADGKVPYSQIPALAISETFPVASQAEMLALSQAEQGDVAIRSDISKSYILRASPSSVLSNWYELLSPTDAVTSVNGQTGVVNLTKSDVGLGNVDNTSDLNKIISTATQTALNAKANISGQVFTGAVSATNLSGTNTGDNAPNSLYSGLVTNATHTGEVTGSTALTITNGAVTNAKLANVATSTLKGRVAATTGVVEDLTASQVRTLLNVADGANNYVHPANHLASIITQDASNRFVTDTEKSAWNAKEPAIASGTISQYWRGDKTWQPFPAQATVDQTIIDGSTNAVSGNAVFDGLALKADISQLHNPVTIGTANGLSLSTQQLSLGLASSGVTGALSGTDWNTFNGKFNTPTGLTTNYLPKWNGSGFGNSKAYDNGTNFEYYGGGSTPSVGVLYNGPSGFSIFQLRNIKSGIEKSWNIENGRTVHGDLGFFNSGGQRVTITDTGNTLFGKTNDAGDGIIQANGNITASPAVSPNQVVVKSQLDAVAGVSGTYTSNGINLVGFNNASYTIKFIKVGRIVTCHLNGTCNASGSSGAFTFDLPSGFPRFSSSPELVSPAIFQNSTNQIFNAYVKHENTTPNTQMYVVIPSGLSASQNHSFASSFAYYTNY